MQNFEEFKPAIRAPFTVMRIASPDPDVMLIDIRRTDLTVRQGLRKIYPAVVIQIPRELVEQEHRGVENAIESEIDAAVEKMCSDLGIIPFVDRDGKQTEYLPLRMADA